MTHNTNMTTTEKQTTYSIAQAAALVGCSRVSLYKQVSSGNLEAYYDASKRGRAMLRISQQALDAYRQRFWNPKAQRAQLDAAHSRADVPDISQQDLADATEFLNELVTVCRGLDLRTEDAGDEAEKTRPSLEAGLDALFAHRMAHGTPAVEDWPELRSLMAKHLRQAMSIVGSVAPTWAQRQQQEQLAYDRLQARVGTVICPGYPVIRTVSGLNIRGEFERILHTIQEEESDSA